MNGAVPLPKVFLHGRPQARIHSIQTHISHVRLGGTLPHHTSTPPRTTETLQTGVAMLRRADSRFKPLFMFCVCAFRSPWQCVSVRELRNETGCQLHDQQSPAVYSCCGSEKERIDQTETRRAYNAEPCLRTNILIQCTGKCRMRQ